jgi:hypothetical protein
MIKRAEEHQGCTLLVTRYLIGSVAAIAAKIKSNTKNFCLLGDLF